MGQNSNMRRKYLKSAKIARSGRSKRTVHPIRQFGHQATASSSEIHNFDDSRETMDMNEVGAAEGDENEEECTAWLGGMIDLSNNEDVDDEDEIMCELEGEELRKSLEEQVIQEAEAMVAAYRNLSRSMPAKEWKRAETNRKLGYNGQSVRTQQRHRQEEKRKELHAEKREKKA
ncbi:hypothetical protein BYT27DRAFT_7209171 [Phlegmacium glaucopus]|nr:hypothetical protein BYT27DRAFT_7209171 [Phlegmacium glaucopus]